MKTTRRHTTVTLTVLAALVVLSSVVGFAATRDPKPASYQYLYQNAERFSVADWMAPDWVLGLGEEGWWDTTMEIEPDLAAAAQAATAWHVAAMTGQQLGGTTPSRKVPGDWVTERDIEDEGKCDNVTVVAAWPARIPLPETPGRTATEAIKTLIGWQGNCLGAPAIGNGDTVPESGRQGTFGAVRISFVYQLDGKIVPEAAMPWSISVTGRMATQPTPEESSDIRCGAQSARYEVAEAFNLMCDAAAADGVTIVATSGTRDRKAQQERHSKLEAALGDDADLWIAWAEDECASRHCAGEAVDISPTPSAIGWLSEPIGCLDGGALGACQDGQRPLIRANLYGFAFSIPAQQQHLEWVLPPSYARTATCEPSRSLAVASQIASSWRCQLASWGYSRQDASPVVAQAVAISRCASGWQANHLEKLGRYANNADPVSGRKQDGRGVFSLGVSQASAAGVRWEDLDGPITSSLAAAQLWKANITAGKPGFDGFACAQTEPNETDSAW